MTGKDRFTTDLYFESHITVDPAKTETEQIAFEKLCTHHGFRPAKLFMQKGTTFEPSNLDMFCTGRGKDYTELFSRFTTVSRL